MLVDNTHLYYIHWEGDPLQLNEERKTSRVFHPNPSYKYMKQKKAYKATTYVIVEEIKHLDWNPYFSFFLLLESSYSN